MKENELIDLDEATFDPYLKENGTVLVDFWAKWCMPCLMQGRMLKKNLNEAPAGLKIAKLDVDENPDMAERFGIRGIPQMYLFVNGEAVKGWTGVTRTSQLFSEIRDHI